MIAAVIPAAGKSLRMGRPKLLLTLGHDSVIGRAVEVLQAGGVDRVVVTAPPADTAEGPAIASLARQAGALVVVPQTQPAEMRESVELALETLARGMPPEKVLLTPGDCPGIQPELIRALLALSAAHPDRVVVPSFRGRRGHPVVLPWELAMEIFDLPATAGANVLVARHSDRIMELPVADALAVVDLDTPADLERYMEMTRATSTLPARVRLFALAKDLAGCPEIDVELPAGGTVGDLRVALASRLPALARLLPTMVIAIDEEFAVDEMIIAPDSRIALIPPVSGGAVAGQGNRPSNHPAWGGEP